MVSPSLMELFEQGIGADEQDVVARPASPVADCRGQERLPHAGRTHENDVLVSLDKAEPKQFPNSVTVEADRSIPIEGLQGLLLGEVGLLEPPSQIMLVAAVDLVLKDQLEEVLLGQLRLTGIGNTLRQTEEDPGKPQPLEHGFK